MLLDRIHQTLVTKSHFLESVWHRKYFTAAPFPIIVYGEKAFWASVQHVMIPGVVATKINSQHSTVPWGLVSTCGCIKSVFISG